MNIPKALGLAIAIAIASSQSLHAQSCSGGADGGMDATGNQCNAYRSVTVLAAAPGAVSPGDPIGANSSARVRPVAIRPSENLLPQFGPAILARSARRASIAVIAPAATVSSDNTSMATCSGGSNGGMGPTGCQCSENPTMDDDNYASKRR